MKKTILIALIALFLVSCVQVNTNDTTKQDTIPPSGSTSPGSPDAVSSSPPASNTPNNLPDEVSILIAKGKSVKSLQFNGEEPGVVILFKGDKIRKTASTFPRTYKAGEYFTHTFIDRIAKTAYAACLSGSDCKYNRTTTYNNTAYAVSFDEENVETPLDVLDWLSQQASVTKKGSERIQQRNTIVVEYTNADGLREELLIEDYYGVPVEKRTFNADNETIKKINYNIDRINNIKDNEVEMTAVVRE